MAKQHNLAAALFIPRVLRALERTAAGLDNEAAPADLIGQARHRFREGSEGADNTMREGAQRARSELDTLLQRVLDIAGKAA